MEDNLVESAAQKLDNGFICREWLLEELYGPKYDWKNIVGSSTEETNTLSMLKKLGKAPLTGLSEDTDPGTISDTTHAVLDFYKLLVSFLSDMFPDNGIFRQFEINKVNYEEFSPFDLIKLAEFSQDELEKICEFLDDFYNFEVVSAGKVVKKYFSDDSDHSNMVVQIDQTRAFMQNQDEGSYLMQVVSQLKADVNTLSQGIVQQTKPSEKSNIEDAEDISVSLIATLNLD